MTRTAKQSQLSLEEQFIEKCSTLAEIMVSYKTMVKPSMRTKVSSSRDVYDFLLTIWNHNIEHVEEFIVLYLNRANRVLGWARVSQGGISGTVADPKVIFQIALKANASSIILAHNHPSGNLQPSESDKKLTDKMKHAGQFLDLPILDHLIVTSEGYFSFADEGHV